MSRIGDLAACVLERELAMILSVTPSSEAYRQIGRTTHDVIQDMLRGWGRRGLFGGLVGLCTQQRLFEINVEYEDGYLSLVLEPSLAQALKITPGTVLTSRCLYPEGPQQLGDIDSTYGSLQEAIGLMSGTFHAEAPVPRPSRALELASLEEKP